MSLLAIRNPLGTNVADVTYRYWRPPVGALAGRYGWPQQLSDNAPMEALAKILELLKVPARYVLGVLVACSILVFGPASLISQLGLTRLRQEGKTYLGLLFLLLVAISCASVIGALKGKLENHRLRRSLRKRLHLLTIEEKRILAGYIEGKTRSQYLSIQSGVVKGLEQDMVIYRAASISSPMHGATAFAYNIQDWAWEYLNQHRELLAHRADP